MICPRPSDSLVSRLRRAALTLSFAGMAGSASAQYTGQFSSANFGTGNFDTAAGIDTTKTFPVKVDLNDSPGATVNGVAFTASTGANPSGTGTGGVTWSMTGVGNAYNGGGTLPGGALGTMTNKFIYGAGTTPEVLTLNGLTTGETYIVSFYNRSWEAAGGRVQNLSASGASSTSGYQFDQNTGAAGQGSLNVLRYTFRAATAQQLLNFVAAVSGTTMHQYGFSLEQVYNNNYTGGTTWSTSTWSGALPSGQGRNAFFTAQGAATAMDLDSNRTVGHLQFDGANAWTINTSTASTLNLQADTGGVTTLNSLSGSHTINPNITIQNNVLKSGPGTLTINGQVAGTPLTGFHNTAGTLALTNPLNSFTGELIMANGSVTEVTSLSNYGVPSAIGARTLAQENTSVTGVGLHFQGGTLKFTGSTAQSTDRHIRMLTGNGATIDASGTNPAATLSFTQSGTNINLFDTGGTRTLTLTGSNAGNNLFALQLTNQGGNATSLLKSGTGTWEISNAASTYTGTTTVRQGTLNMTGNRTTNSGGITVADTAGQTATLNISNGTYSVGGNFVVAAGDNTVSGTVNQTGGALTLTGTQMIVGNNGGGIAGSQGSTGTYNLSAGSLNGAASTSRGVILGVNHGTTGIFNLSGTGNLNLANSNLQVGRSENTGATAASGFFSQTGGTATVGTLGVGGLVGANNANNSGTLNLTGGTFAATSISAFGGGDNSAASINIGGNAVVTLPAIPKVRGAGAVTSITFDGGTLKAGGSSPTYMENLTFAQIKNGGLNLDTNGFDITIAQSFDNFAGQTGTLTKGGAGILTLTGASTYSGLTTVSQGSLLANNTSGSATGPGNVSVASGATFGGTGAISGSVVTSAGSFLSPGASIESLSVGSASGSGTLLIEFDASAGAPIDFLTVVSTLDITSMPVTFTQTGTALTDPAYPFASYGTLTGSAFASTTGLPSGYTLDYNYLGGNTIALVAIPEPATAMSIFGSLALLGLHRRRK